MEIKPLTNEQIARNEKKLNMTLDDIIKMSKKTTSNPRKPRALNKSQKFPNSGAAQKNSLNVRRLMVSRSSVRQNKSQKLPNRNAARGNSSNVRRFMDSRASVRQGVLAQRRSNFQSNQFCLATAIARKVAAAPIHSRHLNRNRMVNWNQPRVGTSPIQRKSIEGSFSNKRQVKVVSKQWGTQSSGSLFANMNEQRMKIATQQNNINNTWHSQRRGGHQHQQRGRGQFSNWAYKSIRSRFGVIV